MERLYASETMQEIYSVSCPTCGRECRMDKKPYGLRYACAFCDKIVLIAWKIGECMKVSEIKPGTGSINVEGVIEEVSSEREINKYGRVLRVANTKLKDASGVVSLILWNDQIDMVKRGVKVRIENGYCNEWQGEPQLTLGKFGKITVI